MKESAVARSDSEAADFVEVPPVQPKPTGNIIAYPSSAGVAVADEKQRRERLRKRRRRLAMFIKLETIALFFLALALTGATSEVMRQAGLLPAFKLALIPTGLAVAIIPVIFFGSTRQEYRYRERRKARLKIGKRSARDISRS